MAAVRVVLASAAGVEREHPEVTCAADEFRDADVRERWSGTCRGALEEQDQRTLAVHIVVRAGSTVQLLAETLRLLTEPFVVHEVRIDEDVL